MTRCLLKTLLIVIAFLLSLLPSLGEEAGTLWKIDDFEDGDLVAESGLSWVALADDLAGGESMGTLTVSPGAPGTARGSLQLTGRRAGAKGSFVAAWVSLEKTGRSVDLAAYDEIRLRVRGSGRLLVGFRCGFMNYMAEVQAGPAWTSERIPFSRLVPMGKAPEAAHFTPENTGYFGISTPIMTDAAPAPPADVQFQIDDVELHASGGASKTPAAVGPPGAVATYPFTSLASIPVDGWVEAATDPAGDANAPALPDATRLEIRSLPGDAIVWFRMTLRETPHDRWMGVNVALDVDGDPNNGQAWWGSNKTFKFDQIVTAWCFNVGAGCEGYFGVSDAARASKGDYSGGGEGLKFAIDKDRRAFVLGVPRAALSLGAAPARLVAAVGSALLYGDDVPSTGAALLR